MKGDWRVLLGILFVVLLGWLIYLLKPILTPFLAGALLAYLGNPLVDRLQRRGMSRMAAVAVVFVSLSAMGVLGVLIMVPLLGLQLQMIVQKTPVFLLWLQQNFVPWVSQQFDLDFGHIEFEQVKETALKGLGQFGDLAGQLLVKITSSGLALLVFVGNVALVPVVSFYLMKDWSMLMNRVRQLLPRLVEPTVVRLARECDEVIAAFVRGQLWVMLSLGAVYSVGLWLVGIPMAFLIGMIAGLASIVPYLGFFVGVTASLIAAFVQYHDWLHLGLVFAVFGVGQALEGMVLTPLLVGDRIGLHPVVVIFAVLAGAQLFGFVGMLLALPVAAVILVLVRYFYQVYLDSNLYGAPSDEKNF